MYPTYSSSIFTLISFKIQLAVYGIFVPLAPIYSYFKAVRLWPLSDMSETALPKAMENTEVDRVLAQLNLINIQLIVITAELLKYI